MLCILPSFKNVPTMLLRVQATHVKFHLYHKDIVSLFVAQFSVWC